jgi:hypothetical protein
MGCRSVLPLKLSGPGNVAKKFSWMTRALITRSGNGRKARSDQERQSFRHFVYNNSDIMTNQWRFGIFGSSVVKYPVAGHNPNLLDPPGGASLNLWPRSSVLSSHRSPEDGRRTKFRNVVFFIKTLRRWINSKRIIIHIVPNKPSSETFKLILI